MADHGPRQLRRLLSSTFDPKLKGHLASYILQIVLATGVLAVALLAEDIVSGGAVSRGIIVAALGSTAFILFITPHSNAARPRNALGGHLIALMVGTVLGALVGSETVRQFLTGGELHLGIEAALAVGLSMFLMAVTNTEHAPAAGTAMAVSAHSFTWKLALFFMISVLLLVAIHQLLRTRMRDLS